MLSPRPLELYHERTRRRGVHTLVYWLVRAVLQPALLAYFRVRRTGHRHIATALAEGSRNRRAGELVGAGLPAQQVEAAVEQTAESLGTVPLLGQAFEGRGIDAPVTAGLCAVLDGSLAADDWLESVRSAPGTGTRRAA
jgi:hypothetical protein